MVIGIPDEEGRRLDRLAELIGSGRITPLVAQTFPLAQVSTALELSKAQHVHGKLVLVVRD